MEPKVQKHKFLGFRAHSARTLLVQKYVTIKHLLLRIQILAALAGNIKCVLLNSPE